MSKRWTAVILLVAFGLRMVGLNGRALWYDEAFSILYAEKEWATMLAGALTPVNGAAAEEHPLLYYALLHGWMELAGQSPLAARYLSVLCGVLTTAVGFALGRQLFDRRAGQATAVIIAVAPFAVYYAQEARMYALLGLLTLSATAVFVHAWRTRRRWAWLAYGVLAGLTLHTHHLGGLFLAAPAGWSVWRWLQLRRARQWRGWLLAHLLALALLAPWLAALPRQLAVVRQGYWIPRPGPVELLQTLLVFHFSSDNQALPAWLTPWALGLSLLPPAFLLLGAARARARPCRLPGAGTLLPALALGPIALAFVISQALPIYTIRALLPAALAYYVLLAGLFVTGPAPTAVKWTTLPAAALVVILALGSHYSYARFPRPPFPAAAAALRDAFNPATDVIVHANKLSFLPLHVYDRALPQAFVADPPGSPADTLARPTQRALGVWAAADLATAVDDHPRVWLVLFERETAEYAAQGRPHPHLAWLAARYTLRERLHFNDLTVYLFVRTGA